MALGTDDPQPGIAWDRAPVDDGSGSDGQGQGTAPGPGRDRDRTNSSTRAQRMVAPLALGAITLGGCVATVVADPGDNGTPLCWSRSVFGVDCPFCGGLRATNSLMHLNVGAAADHNVILAVLIPTAVLMWIWWLVRQWRGTPPPPKVPRWLLVAAGVLLVAFGIVRNLGGPAWIRWLHSDSFVG